MFEDIGNNKFTEIYLEWEQNIVKQPGINGTIPFGKKST